MSRAVRHRFSVVKRFLESEASGGLVLMAVAALAMVVANLPVAPVYFSILHAPLAGLDVLHWINDGLMAVFFLLVGLEIKREMLDGQLSTWSRRVLPGIAAGGGMAVPALIYLAFNFSDSGASHGWAIPAATDIAFALGVISLLGSRVPTSLKVFLTALAIIDDLGAVLIIAVFYTADLHIAALAGAAATTVALICMNRLKVRRLTFYLLVGVLLWFLVLRSGIHATVAGVIVALTIPLQRTEGAVDDETSPLHRLEHGLAPWVAFLIIPIFGFANAGVSLAGFTLDSLVTPVPLGVAAGLFIGKQVGVFGSGWLAIRLGWARLPAHASWRQFYGVSLLCGIGFTISLFIGLLAFRSPELQDATKLGVIVGSLASGSVGWLILRMSKSDPGQAACSEI